MAFEVRCLDAEGRATSSCNEGTSQFLISLLLINIQGLPQRPWPTHTSCLLGRLLTSLDLEGGDCPCWPVGSV